MKNREKVLKISLFTITSFLFVFGINTAVSYDNSPLRYNMANVFLFGAAILLQMKAAEKSKKDKKPASVFSALFTLAVMLGREMYETNTIAGIWKSLTSTAIFLLMFIGLFFVVRAAVILMYAQIVSEEQSGISAGNGKFFSSRYSWIWIWAIIMVAWLPCYLTYYPGIAAYDIGDQTAQAVGAVPYYDHHPPLHTYLWQLSIQFGDLIHVEGLVIYSIGSMALLAAALTSMTRLVAEISDKKFWPILSLAFSALSPVTALLSFNMTKDVPFAALFVFCMVLFFRFLRNPSGFTKRQMICLILVSLLACLMRKNAVFVFLLFAPFLIVRMFRIGEKKKVLLVTVIPLMLFVFINHFVYSWLGVENRGDREFFCVPMQQIANVVVREDSRLSEETKDLIDQYMEYDLIPLRYNPRFCDPVKDLFAVHSYDAVQFVKLYLTLGLQYPLDYIDAFLSLQLPFWYPDAYSVDAFSQNDYILTYDWGCDQYRSLTVFRNVNRFPALYNFYESVADYSLLGKIPVVSSLFSVALPIWLTLFSLIGVASRKNKMWMIFAPILILWLTYVAGPVSIFRYVFPIFVLYPLLLTLTFTKREMV